MANAKPKDSEFAVWLQRAVRDLKSGNLPPESWERHQSPLEDSAAQRRIASLISSIAEKKYDWRQDETDR